MHWLITYAVSLVAFLSIDIAWISLVVRKLYDIELGDIMREKTQLFPAIVFYPLYAAGLVLFAVYPLTLHFNGVHATLATYRDVAVWGAALGVFAYSTFSLTNQAIVKQWKYKLVFADLLWGAVLTGGVSLVGFVVFRALA